MTTCIAAVCQLNKIPRVILCSDWKESTPHLGSSETADKFYRLTDRWVALGAGDSDAIDMLIRAYKAHLSTGIEVTDENIAQVMQGPLNQRKLEVSREYIWSRLAITYDDFLKMGKDRFPDDFFRDKLLEVEDLGPRARLLIAGFTGRNAQASPNIIETTHQWGIRLKENWATIGSGEALAAASLFRCEYDSELEMMEAVYRVYEAKEATEKLPTVGEDTSLDVFGPQSHRITWSDKGFKKFESLLKKYHPQIQKKDFIFDDSYFETSAHAEEPGLSIATAGEGGRKVVR